MVTKRMLLAEILRAIQLPDISELLRERGIPPEEIQEVIAAALKRGVPASESTDVLEETAEVVEETGLSENFGAYVQEYPVEVKDEHPATRTADSGPAGGPHRLWRYGRPTGGDRRGRGGRPPLGR